MNKKELHERYKYTMGLSTWSFNSYKGRNLRPIYTCDGPCGLRIEEDHKVVTALNLPSPSALATSFNRELIRLNGEIIGREANAKKKDVLLAPGLNIKRSALCGRNFEYFSEDPYLNGICGTEYVKGVQSQNVGVSIKHLCCNSQEFSRYFVSAEVSQRALNEIYLEPFRRVIKETNPISIMTSYNKVNGVYNFDNKEFLENKIVKQFGFNGFFMSDWLSVSEKGSSIHGGLHLEMPKKVIEDKYVDRELRKGVFTEKELVENDNHFEECLAKLRSLPKECIFDLDKDHEDAEKIANETSVLVKNVKKILPLRKKDKILVIGEIDNVRINGGGSASVNAYKNESIEKCFVESGFDVRFLKTYDFELEELNKYSDVNKVVFFFKQEWDQEGNDRYYYECPLKQEVAFNKIKEFGKDIVSVIVTGSSFSVKDFYKESKAMLIQYFAGECQNKSLVNTLIGKVNPSGHLNETWMGSLNQNPMYKKDVLKRPFYYSYYDEDIYVGYRYFDLHKKGFILPFGYGLSYSKFEYSSPRMFDKGDTIEFVVDVENKSSIDGKETLFVFASLPSSNIYRPLKELKGFNKEPIPSKSSKTFVVTVNKSDLVSYFECKDTMLVEEGMYHFYLAKNANEIIGEFDLFIEGERFEKQEAPIKLKRKKVSKVWTLDTDVFSFFQTSVCQEIAKEKNQPLDIEFAEQWQSGCLRWAAQKYFWDISHDDMHSKIFPELKRRKEKPLGINYMSDVRKKKWLVTPFQRERK